MGFSRQECWGGLPFPSPGDFPDPGIKPGSPALQADALPSELYLVNVNLTSMIEFVLWGFSDITNFQMFLFVMFLFIYVITLTGNGIIILISRTDQTLQTPMNIFLSNFSFLEICYVSPTLPRMLINLWTQKRHISLLVQHR